MNDASKTVMGAMAEARLEEHHILSRQGTDEETITVDEEIQVDETTGGRKGQKNIRLHAAPWEALAELGRVFTFGENKYDDYNFRKGYRWSLSFDALQRHVWLFWNREDKDAESQLHHMAHAAWHALVLLFYSLTERGADDRPPIEAVNHERIELTDDRPTE